MFPSRTPILYLVQVIGIYLCVLACIALGVILAQPLAIMSVFALQWIPQFPLIPETPEDELGSTPATTKAFRSPPKSSDSVAIKRKSSLSYALY